MSTRSDSVFDTKKILDAVDIIKAQTLLMSEEYRHFKIDLPDSSDVYEATFKWNNPLYINELEFYLFYFEDVIPTYKGASKDKDYGRDIQKYYNQSISRQLNMAEPNVQQEKFVLVIEQYYKDKQVRDLDNRNRKLLIDAIKYNQLIKDDSMQELAIYETGTNGQPNNETIVFLLKQSDFVHFIKERNGKLLQRITEEISFRKTTLMQLNNC